LTFSFLCGRVLSFKSGEGKSKETDMNKILHKCGNEKPIGVVEIKRAGRWWKELDIYPSENFGEFLIEFAKDLGEVTALRVRRFDTNKSPLNDSAKKDKKMRYYTVESWAGWFVAKARNKREAYSEGVEEFGRGYVKKVSLSKQSDIDYYKNVKGEAALN
jgi:hypothetical protein